MDKILFIFGNDVLPQEIDLDDKKKLFEVAGGMWVILFISIILNLI